MGHAIGGGFLEAKTKEEAMREGYADACEFAARNIDRRENPSGDYSNSFRYYDRVFNTEEEAMDFFDRLGSYVDGVCMVKQASASASQKYHHKCMAIREKKRQYWEKVLEDFKERTSKTVGCKKCGTRIPGEVALNRQLRCPNCYNLLISDTVRKRLLSYEEQMTLAEKQYRKDTAETGKPRYWAKYEVHC